MGEEIYFCQSFISKQIDNSLFFYTFGNTLQTSVFRHFVTINMKHSKKLNMVTTMLMESLQMVYESIAVTQLA